MCNPLKVNITTEINYNEGRSSVAYSEDSGISSSNGEDASMVPTIKYNVQSPCSPTKLLGNVYSLSPTDTIESKISTPKLSHINVENTFDTSTIRPNSTSSSLSNLSDNNRSEVESRLSLPEDKTLEFDQKVLYNIFKSKTLLIKKTPICSNSSISVSLEY